MNSRQTLWELFSAMPKEYRPAPFWSWNDRLEREETARQADDMHAHGYGGFFMHSRDGLETDYMGAEWFESVRAAVASAKENGMTAWLYDEDRWPSGTAGGKVPARGGDACRAKAVTLQVLQGARAAAYLIEGAKDARALFMARLKENALEECRRVAAGERALPEGWSLLVFRVEVSGPSEWFNDDAPADNLNPESVRLFLEETYEGYRREIGAEFGKTVAGIFTDEPNIADFHCAFIEHRGWIPWTDGFEAYYWKQRGRDPIDGLPLIFFSGEGSGKARHDYWRTIAERFCGAYSAQIGAWCKQNGLAFTGHYLLENELGSSTRMAGALMPHYVHQDVPGVDLLQEQIDEILTLKQCASVANQFGKKRVLSESYACIGWELDFEGQKWVADWQYALGVNLLCPHLALYSLRGCRKRDYPPSFDYNTSWWKYNGVMGDYFARIGAVLAQGTPVREMLVIHPLSTAWSMLGADPVQRGEWFDEAALWEVNAYGDAFSRFLKRILDRHIDFDLGDESILAEYGGAEEGALVVRQAKYRLAVIPRVTTLLQSTVALLSAFMESGGRVIALEPLPRLVEAEPNNALASFFAHPNMRIARDEQAALQIMEALLPRRISFRSASGEEQSHLLHMLRELPGIQTLFAVNTDRERGCRVRVSLDRGGAVEEWDPLTGRAMPVPADLLEGSVAFDAAFGPAGSRLYVISDDKLHAADEDNGTRAQTEEVLIATLGPDWNYLRTEYNALTLDRCRWRMAAQESGLEETPFSVETDVWMAQRDVRARLDMRQVYLNGLPQRYRWIHEKKPGDGSAVELEFRFVVLDPPAQRTLLALEGARECSITLNGEPVSAKPDSWYLDRSFQTVPLPPLRQGENRICLRRAYYNRTELEDIYLLGEFGVNPAREITREPEKLRAGDWCNQGFFHYNGSIVYRADFDLSEMPNEREAILLLLGAFRAITIEVRVNGRAAGMIPWRAANPLDLTPCVRQGNNTLEIEVMGSPRNLLGPLHDASGSANISCESFRTLGTAYDGAYRTAPYGLLEDVRIIKRATK